MKSIKLACAAIILLAAASSLAQTLVERLFVMRTETTTVDQFAGMSHTCLLVFPDGHYRMEKSYQGSQGGDPETKVYLDTLPDADLKSLQAVLDDAKFQEINTPERHGGIIKDMDTLYVTVPREHAMQNISFMNSADRRPYEKVLKPFQNALKNVEKRKVQAAKAEKSNNCDPPRVMYRLTGSGSPPPDQN